MKKIFGILAIAGILTGCEPTVRDSHDMAAAVNMVQELRDCKTYRLNDGSRDMYVVRCPASSTVSTATVEKHPVYTSTVMDSIDPNGGDPK